MALKTLIFYGSYRRDRLGMSLARFLVRGFEGLGHGAELIDAKAVGLPMLERMLKEYPPGAAPEAMSRLGAKIREAHAFVFVTGEYNWGPQPGLKNLTDHYLEEWFWRPAAIASYSSGKLAGVRAAYAWRNILSEMGMVVISSTLALGEAGKVLTPEGQPYGEAGAAFAQRFGRFAADLIWWAEAALAQRAKQTPPY